MSLRVEVQDAELRAAFDRLTRAVADPTEALQAVGDELVAQTALAFHDARSPFGPPWARLSPITAALRRKGNSPGGSKPLHDTGALSSSVVAEADRSSVTVGTNWMSDPDHIATGAAIHQFGGKAGRGRKVTIPARPFLPVDIDGELAPQTQSAVLDIFNDFLADAWGR